MSETGIQKKHTKPRPKIGVDFSLVFLLAVYLVLAALILLAILSARDGAVPVSLPNEIVAWQFFAVFMGFLLLVAFLIRRIRARLLWELVLPITLFLGVWLYVWFLLPFEIALLVAAAVTIVQARIRRVFVHDIFVLLGAVGIALNFAFIFHPHTVLIFLVALIMYDIVAGRPGGVAVQFASTLIHRGIIPGLIIPGKLKELGESIPTAIKKPQAIFLGAGDLILPMTFVAQAAAIRLETSLFIVAGIMIGAVWLGKRGASAPYPALVPLGIGAGVPFILMLLLHLL